MVTVGYRELQGVLGRPVARIFWGELQLNEETDRTKPGGKLVCLKLHFEHFEKLAIFQTFNLEKLFFFK